MDIQTRKLSELVYAEYNPRKRLTPLDPEYQKIARSIDEFGYVDPIIINADNTIIGGHQRATVMRDKGYTEVQVVVVNLGKEQEKALNVALNKISGEWNLEMLKDLLTDLDSSGYDPTLTGFDFDEIENLMEQFHENDPVEDDGFDAEEEYQSIETPQTQAGDMWYLGAHRLLCGDSTDTAAVKRLMGEDKAQLIVTDPPYNVDYHGAVGSIANDNMGDAAFYKFLLSAFRNMYATAEPGAAVYVFHADSEGLNFRKAFKDSGFLMKQCLVWVKNSLVLGRQDYQWRHEPILYGWKDGAAHYFINDRTQTTVIDDSYRENFKRMTKEQLVNYITDYFDNLDRTAQSVIYHDKPSRNELHPTMKPVALVGKLINNSSKRGWMVQDLFAGSGSTMIACEKLGRQSRLMEYDPKYADVIVKRYVALTEDTSCYCVTADGARVDYAEMFGG
jgi:DNA modification methylase